MAKRNPVPDCDGHAEFYPDCYFLQWRGLEER